MSVNEEQFPNVNESFDEDDVEALFESEEEEEVDEEPSIVDENDLTEKYTRSQLRIVRTNMDYSLHTLRQSLADNNYINMSPIYQRRARWDNKKKSQLIESFLMNIPVPPIFLFENDYNQYEVMDGRQRLESVKDYLNNQYPLRGLEFWKELNGKRFGSLPLTIQRGLLRRTLSAIVLLAETTRQTFSKEDLKFDVRMVLFKRLNTGGIKLNPQELRNALYPSAFNTMLLHAARTDVFTKIWGIPPKTHDEDESPSEFLLKNTLYKTMADCELVLRFFAIKETIELKLTGGLSRLLDQCIKRHVDDDTDSADRLEKMYLSCLSKLDETFDGRPFVLPNTKKPSSPLYDALTVSLSLHPDTNPVLDKVNIKNRLAKSLANPKEYDVLTGKGNTVDLIRQRVRLAEKIILG